MQASWEDGFDQRVFMERLLSASTHGVANEFNGEGAGLIALLRSMVKFSENLPWGVRRQILSSALREAVKAKAETPKELLLHIQVAAKAYGDKPPSPFVLFTSISILQSNKPPRWKTHDVKLSFLDSMPKRVLAERASLFREKSWLSVDHEPKMKAVKLEVEARNFEEAATRCLDAIDLQRGIWNFIKTLEWRVTLGGVVSPVNSIFLGPLHTFHEKTGALSSGEIWYDPEFWPDAKIVDLHKNGPALLERSQRIKRILHKHNYARHIENAFIRYTRALDLKDHDLVIQKLWSLLEFLTDTGLASYDKTIRRARFLFDEFSFQGQVLEHLRRFRNRSVHGGSSTGNVEAEVYQLKRVVEAAIQFHLGNSFKFKTMTEACHFLDLPTDVAQLSVYQKNIQNAIVFRSS